MGVGDTLATGEDPSGAPELVSTDASGTLPVTAIRTIEPDAAVTNTGYDIVADNLAAGVTGTYNASSDLLDSAGTAGFIAPVPDDTEPVKVHVMTPLGFMLAMFGLVVFATRCINKR